MTTKEMEQDHKEKRKITSGTQNYKNDHKQLQI